MRKSLIITGAVVAGLLATGITGDRWAAATAADRVAERLRCVAGLPEPPDVSLGGFPFLTQIARGTFTEVQVTADSVAIGRFQGGVTATARKVRTAGGSVRAASLTVTAIIQYGHFPALPSPTPAGQPAKESAPAEESAAGEGGAAGESATGDGSAVGGAAELGYDGAGRLKMAITAQFLGRNVPVVVHASTEISGNSLVVTPVEVEIPAIGIRLPAAQLGDKAQPRTINLPALPAGLSYQGVTAAEDGLRITATGTNLSMTGKSGTSDQNCGKDER